MRRKASSRARTQVEKVEKSLSLISASLLGELALTQPRFLGHLRAEEKRTREGLRRSVVGSVASRKATRRHCRLIPLPATFVTHDPPLFLSFLLLYLSSLPLAFSLALFLSLSLSSSAISVSSLSLSHHTPHAQVPDPALSTVPVSALTLTLYDVSTTSFLSSPCPTDTLSHAPSHALFKRGKK